MGVTKLYKSVGLGQWMSPNPKYFKKVGAMGVTKPYTFIKFGAMTVTKPYIIYKVWGPGMSPNLINL